MSPCTLLALVAFAAADPPLLTLDEAVAESRAHNHRVEIAAIEVAKSAERADALRARRLPSLRLDAAEARLLTSLDFTFPAGTFGELPPLGKFPPKETNVSTPARFVTAALASLNQPITQQYRLALGIRALDLGRDLAQEELRQQQHQTAAEVRTAYYQLATLQSGVVALRDLVRALEEVDGLTRRYVAEQLALRADALEVKSRLAHERWRLSTAEDALETQREHLNQLMGRELTVPFRVVDPVDLAPPGTGISLEDARERAARNRPEIRQAHIKSVQAGLDLRLAHAEWIPDITLSAHYLRLVNFQFLPEQEADVGLYLSWEVFDWGRRNREAAQKSRTVQQAQSGVVEAQQQIAVEVGLRWRKLREAAQLLSASRLAVEAAQENRKTVGNRYREDAKMLRDLLQAEAQLSGARHDFSEALTGYWTAAADLERAIGDDP